MTIQVVAHQQDSPTERAYEHITHVLDILSSTPLHENRLRDRATSQGAHQLATGIALSFDAAEHHAQALAPKSPELLVITAIIDAASQHGVRLPSLERRQLASDVANQMTKQQADNLALSIAQSNPTPQDHTTRSFVQYQNAVTVHIDHAIDSRYPYRPTQAAENILAITRGKPVSDHTPDFAANPPFLTLDFTQQSQLLSSLTPERTHSLLRAQIDHWTGARTTPDTSALTPFLNATRRHFTPPLQKAYENSDEAGYDDLQAQLTTCAEILRHHVPSNNLRPYSHSYPTAPLVAGEEAAQEYQDGGKRLEPLRARLTYITVPLVTNTCNNLLEELETAALRITSPTDHFHPMQYQSITAIADAFAIRKSLYEEHPQPAEPQEEAPFTHINVDSEYLLRIEPSVDLNQSSHPHKVAYEAAADNAVHYLIHAQHTGNPLLFDATMASFHQQVAEIATIDFSKIDYPAEQATASHTDPDYAAQATINLADTYISHLTKHTGHPLSSTIQRIIRTAALILEHVTTDQTPDADLDAVNRLHVYADIAYAEAIIAAITEHIDTAAPLETETAA